MIGLCGFYDEREIVTSFSSFSDEREMIGLALHFIDGLAHMWGVDWMAIKYQ